MEKHFGELVDYDFAARMEDALDAISRGEAEQVRWLQRFYFGENRDGLKELVNHLDEIDAKAVSSCRLPDNVILARVGRGAPYLDGDGQRVNIAEDIAPDELTKDKAEELYAQPSGERELGDDPQNGHPIVVKTGR